jgi:hypothetical protein
MKKLIALILCFMFPSVSYAGSSVSSLKEGQKAPFDGYLFNYDAYSAVIVDKENIIKTCELDKKLIADKCASECKLLSNTCSNEKETIQKNFKIMIDAKDLEIKRLTEINFSNNPPSRGLWFGLGAAAGVVLSLTTVYLVKKI